MRTRCSWIVGIGIGLIVAGCAPAPEHTDASAEQLSRPIKVEDPLSVQPLPEALPAIPSGTTSVAWRMHDRALATQVLLALSDASDLRRYLPLVAVHDGVVTLQGVVSSKELRDRMVQLARRVPGVVAVQDKLELEALDTPVRYHTVQSGETLWEIARRYGLSVTELRRLNGLRRHTIRPGQPLRVQ